MKTAECFGGKGCFEDLSAIPSLGSVTPKGSFVDPQSITAQPDPRFSLWALQDGGRQLNHSWDSNPLRNCDYEWMLGPTSQSYSVEVERDTDLSLTAEVEKTGGKNKTQ